MVFVDQDAAAVARRLGVDADFGRDERSVRSNPPSVRIFLRNRSWNRIGQSICLNGLGAMNSWVEFRTNLCRRRYF